MAECRCGCGLTPKGAKSEFVAGHMSGYAMDLFRRVRIGDGDASREMVQRGWVDWYEKLKAAGSLPRLKIDPMNPRSWPVLAEPPPPVYTDEQKMTALRLALRDGPVEASHATGIPSKEIRRWLGLWQRLRRRMNDGNLSGDIEYQFYRISREREQARTSD